VPLARQALATLRPPPKLTVSEWADRYRYLSPENCSEPGKWHTDRAPYQRGMMDAVSDPHTHTVVAMTSRRPFPFWTLPEMGGEITPGLGSGATRNPAGGLQRAETAEPPRKNSGVKRDQVSASWIGDAWPLDTD